MTDQRLKDAATVNNSSVIKGQRGFFFAKSQLDARKALPNHRNSKNR